MFDGRWQALRYRINGRESVGLFSSEQEAIDALLVPDSDVEDIEESATIKDLKVKINKLEWDLFLAQCINERQQEQITLLKSQLETAQ